MPNDDGGVSVAEFAKVAAGVTLLLAGLATIGSATGVLDTMLRDYPNWAAGALALTLFAGFWAALAGLIPSLKGPLLGVATFFFFLSVLWALILITIARGDRPTPNITVKVTAPTETADPVRISGTATAESMKANQTIKVWVLANDKRLYDAQLGSDAGSKVKVPFDFFMPQSTEERVLKVIAWIDERPSRCISATLSDIGRAIRKAAGCVLVRVPAKG